MSKPDFTEDQMTAIDKGVIKVYIKARAILPPELLGAGKGDPASALRSVAYEYALTHRADIESREGWQISHHIAGRLQQHVSRTVKARMERPYGIGDKFTRAVSRAVKEHEKSTGKLKPRQYPARYRETPSPFETPTVLEMLDRFGVIIPDDKAQFVVKGTRNGRPVFEDAAVFAKLHTRKPTREEFWFEVCDEHDRKGFRKQIAESFAAGICACDNCTTA